MNIKDNFKDTIQNLREQLNQLESRVDETNFEETTQEQRDNLENQIDKVKTDSQNLASKITDKLRSGKNAIQRKARNVKHAVTS